MNEFEFRCFVCNEKTNAQFRPLVSNHAVANHVAGKIKVNEYQHTSWIKATLPLLDGIH